VNIYLCVFRDHTPSWRELGIFERAIVRHINSVEARKAFSEHLAKQGYEVEPIENVRTFQTTLLTPDGDAGVIQSL
jgi:hypothetical protein